MKIYPRSAWTSHIPMGFREYHPKLPYFLDDPDIEFCLPEPADANRLYLYINPLDALNELFSGIRNLGDINYNFALPSNQLGAYTIRGQSNKCEGFDTLRVLLLVGKQEDPSDVLKINQQDFLNSQDTFLEAPGLITKVDLGPTSGVTVFDLIEYLTWLNYFRGPNTGVWAEHLTNAVNEFQLYNDLPITGEWDELTAKICTSDLFQPVDRNGNLRTSRPPVGNYVSGQLI